MNQACDPMIRIRDLQVIFDTAPAPWHAVNGVNLDVHRGEVVALIGESGSGKSVTLRTLLRLHNERRCRVGGHVSVDGCDVLALSQSQLRRYRGATASMVFQDPLLAFDPVYTVGHQIIETILCHERVRRSEAEFRALELFQRVQIPSPERRLQAYPHEMSGGMRQRAMIALALACRPKVLLADEPTTALDATVQIQILLLLRELQRDLALSIIFVTHDIGAAVEVADRIAVMYAGRIVELGTTRELLSAPRHPYTIALLQSRHPEAMRRGERLNTIGGGPPDLTALPSGCAFADRCPVAQANCRTHQPTPIPADSVHRASCLRLESEVA